MPYARQGQGCCIRTGCRISHYLIFLVIACLFISPAFARDQLSISAAPDVIADYRRFIKDKDPLQITDFSGPYSRRDVVDLVLLQQALAMGGLAEPVVFVPDTTYRRVLRQISNGLLLSTTTTKWYADLHDSQEQLYISPPVIRDGEFTAGLYSLADNADVLNASSAELKHLRVISTPQWRTDLQALRESGFDNIVFGGDWDSMLKMLEAGRGELMLMPFPGSEDLSVRINGLNLQPVNGQRVALSGSRHWIVSRTHPQGAAYFNALVEGMNKLRALGRFDKAYRECGFFNPLTEHWPLLNPPAGAAD